MSLDKPSALEDFPRGQGKVTAKAIGGQITWDMSAMDIIEQFERQQGITGRFRIMFLGNDQHVYVKEFEGDYRILQAIGKMFSQKLNAWLSYRQDSEGDWHKDEGYNVAAINQALDAGWPVKLLSNDQD